MPGLRTERGKESQRSAVEVPHSVARDTCPARCLMVSVKPAVLFDLGNTLASYYQPADFRPILFDAVNAVLLELDRLGETRPKAERAHAAALAENREAPDFRFTPISGRFERIFEIPLVDKPELALRLTEVFLAPIFAVGRVYEDSVSALLRLRNDGYTLGIVSNSPWGSPSKLWRQEVRRLGLDVLVDAVVFCGDVGWRKPSPHIFLHAAKKLGRAPADCVFVGDDLRWDISGSDAVGMRSYLLDRDGRHRNYDGSRGTNLEELIEWLKRVE